MVILGKVVHRFGLMFCSLSIAAISFPSAVHAQTRVSSDRVEYTFKRGDTLIDLASKYLRKRSNYKTVQRINRIADPRYIPVGKTISVPFSMLKYRASGASLSAYRGNVSIATNGRTRKPVKGLEMAEGTRLTTAAASSMTLQLEDGSRVSMPSNSTMRITRLRRILLTNSIDYEFAVDNGRIRSKVTPFEKKADRYRVRTPVAVSAVRGTDYRTRVDGLTGTAFSETVEGEVLVAAGASITDNAISVPLGTGAAASISGDLLKATLLSPPKLNDPAKVQSEEILQFNAVARNEAVGHRMVIAADAGFIDIVAERSSDSTIIELPSLADGRYFAKATAIDAKGFEGMPVTHSFKRQLSTLSGSAEKEDFGYRFKWSGQGQGQRLYRFQLLRGGKDVVPMVDEAALTDEVITMSDLPDGDYFWRVGVTQFSNDPDDINAIEKWTDFEKLTVAS